MRAEATKTDYDRKLRKVLCEFFKPILKGDPELVKREQSEPKIKKKGVKRKFSDADFEVRAAEFVKRAKEDTDWAENVLMKLGEKFKERANLSKTDSNYINPVSLKNYFVPVQKLLEMNRVNLAWKMIRSTFPEIDGKDDTREYTYDEIRKMLNHCKVMDKVLVLLASSSGIRAGAFAFPMAGENTISLTASSIGPKMMNMDVPPMARTHTIASGSLMTFEQDPENDFGSRTYDLPVYVLKQQQSKTLDGSEPGKQILVTLATTSDKIVSGEPTTLVLTITQPDGEMITHPDALISVRKGFYKVSESAEPGDPMMPMNGAYHGHVGQMSYTAAFPNAGNYVVNVDLNSLPVSNYIFGQTSARFNVLVMDPNGESSISTQSQTKNTVTIVGLESPFYQPNNIKVSKGTTLTFDNVDGNFHTVTSGNAASGPNGNFDSGLIKAGETFDLNLDKSGTFEYFCTIHTNMVGTITVS